MRSLTELINLEEPGIGLVNEWISQAKNPVERLVCDTEAGERTLLALQVTTRSPLGALAYQTGGLLVDNGWLRVLGAGCERLPRALDTWNRLPEPPAKQRFPGALLIADDAVGGFFALNGGAFGAGTPPTVWYLAPDTLEWENSELGYSDWLVWAFTGDLEQYYDGMRWPTWQDDVASLRGDQGIAVYPFLWAQEGGTVAERSRSPVPLEEQWGLHACEFPRQMGLPHVALPE